MSGLLTDALDEFDPTDATLVSGTPQEYAKESQACEFSLNHVRRVCATHDGLIDTKGRVMIPLHSAGSPALSGEYLLYSENSLFPAYGYYDAESDTNRRIAVEDIDETGYRWRVRYWTDEYQPSRDCQTKGEKERQTGPQAVVRPREGTDADDDTFYSHLLKFVSDMRDADRSECRSAFDSLQYNTYRRQHGGLKVGLPIRYIETGAGGDVCTIIAPSDTVRNSVPSDTGLYPDNEVLIDVLNSGGAALSRAEEAALPAEGIINKINDCTLGVELFPERTSTTATRALQKVFTSGSGSVGVGLLHNPIPFDREQAAIQSARDVPAKRSVLTGTEPVLYDAIAAHETTFPTLNEYQTQAAKRALSAEQIHCIHGPPGTGKTRTLIALARELVKRGNRVLACAHSNQATDNLIVGTSTVETSAPDSLHAHAEAGELAIARVGNGSRDPVVRGNYVGRSVNRADIVAATMSSAHQFDVDEFDVAIVDEASQASVPATLIPFTAARRTILAGDHKQLPPYASSELEKRDMEVSLFEYLMERFGTDVSTLLKRQYRMNEAIARFPNESFYDGELETAARNRDWTRSGLSPIKGYQITGDEESARGHSRRNKQEADLVAYEVAKLLDAGIEPKEIGVITAYRGQIGVIKNAINRLDRDISMPKVDTIDSFQGSERSVIIVSFVRSNDDGRAGFLTFPDEGRRRLNVAMTRAKHRLVLIGDWETLGAQTSEESCAATYRELREYLQEVGALEEYEPNVMKGSRP